MKNTIRDWLCRTVQLHLQALRLLQHCSDTLM